MAEVESNLLCLAESSKLDYDAVLDELEEQVPNNNESTVLEGENDEESIIDDALNAFVEKYNQTEISTIVPSTPTTVSSTTTPTTQTNQTKEQASIERNSPSPSSTPTLCQSASRIPSSTSCPSLTLQFESLTFYLFSSPQSSSPSSSPLIGNAEANKPVLFADKPSLFKANLETLLQELQTRLSISNVDVSLEFPELQLLVSSHMIYAQKITLAHLYEITKVISSRSAKPLSFYAILKVKKNSFVAQYNSLVALTQSSLSGAVAGDSLSSSEQGKDESSLSSDPLQSGEELELSGDLEDLENSSSESLSDEEVEELNGDLDPPLAVSYSRSPSPTQSPKRTFDDLEDSDGEGDSFTNKRTKV